MSTALNFKLRHYHRIERGEDESVYCAHDGDPYGPFDWQKCLYRGIERERNTVCMIHKVELVGSPEARVDSKAATGE